METHVISSVTLREHACHLINDTNMKIYVMVSIKIKTLGTNALCLKNTWICLNRYVRFSFLLLASYVEERWHYEKHILLCVLLYVHRNHRFIRDGSPGRPPGLSHKQLLSSVDEKHSPKSRIYRHSVKGSGCKFLNLKMTLEKILTAKNDVLGISYLQ